ncbi:MAG: helix-turn-helix transcriptional regulator [Acidobacteria bacterium]|nr:helix-turn-helix transcriptional regulator [Acidobacteriota bacterium]
MGLTETLQQARKARRLSQLELSMRIGVSQRHVSFVESGRSKPSRELLLGWLETLDLPLATQNAAMLEAGYAPSYTAAPLEDPALVVAHQAILRLLEAHDPMPALVLDAQWNLVRVNRGGMWLAGTLVPWAQGPMNLLDLMAHPEGFLKTVTNLGEVAPSILVHPREEAVVKPELLPRVEAVANLIEGRLGSVRHSGRKMSPVMTTRFATVHGELSFFSMFTTFGTPQDITLESLRVEHMFAADAETRKTLERLV